MRACLLAEEIPRPRCTPAHSSIVAETKVAPPVVRAMAPARARVSDDNTVLHAYPKNFSQRLATTLSLISAGMPPAFPQTRNWWLPIDYFSSGSTACFRR